MKKSNKIISNYIFNVTYNILVIALPLVTVPYVSRVLGAEKIGQYGYTQSVVNIFVLLGTLGTQIFAQREIAYHQDEKEERSRVFWEMLTLRMLTVGVACIIYGIMVYINKHYTILYMIQVIDIAAAFFDITWFFQGIEEFKKTVIRNILVKLVIVIMMFLLVRDEKDLPVYVLLHSLALLIGNLSLYWYLPKYVISISIKKIHPLRYLRRVLVLFVPQVAVQIYATLDKAMLGYLCGASQVSQVGYYEQAQKIVRLLLSVIAALGTVMLPRMANAFSKNEVTVIKKSLNSSLEFVFFCGCPLMIGISSLAPKLVPWFYGSGYEPVKQLIVATSPIIVITGISNLIGMQFLLPVQKQKEYTIAVTLASLSNVVLNYLLIPRYQSMGAVVASVFAECVAIAIELFFVHKYIEGRKIMCMAAKYAVFSVFMGICVWQMTKSMPANVWTTLIQIVIGMLSYGTILLICRDRFLMMVLHKATIFRKHWGKMNNER